MPSDTEANNIDRNKYIAELSRLLGFMSARDRQAAIEKYSAMFESADNDAAVIEELGSPTKLAIAVARDYVPSDMREDEPDAEPEPLPQLDMDNIEAAPADSPAEADASPEAETAEAAEASETAEAAEAPEAESESEPEAEVEPESEPEPEAEPETEPEPEAEPEAEPGALFEPEAAMSPEQLSAIEQAVAGQVEAAEAEPEAESEPPEAELESRVKVKPVALVLYIIVSLVIGLPIAIILIAVGTPVLVLGGGLIALVIYAAAQIIPLFSMVSDIMLISGAGLVLCAAGLVVTWFGLWVSLSLGGAWIGGVIFRLGSRLCFKKEAAQ